MGQHVQSLSPSHHFYHACDCANFAQYQATLKQNSTYTATDAVWTAFHCVWWVQLPPERFSCWCSERPLLRSCCPAGTGPVGHAAIRPFTATPCLDAGTNCVPQAWSVASVKNVQCASLEEQCDKFVGQHSCLGQNIQHAFSNTQHRRS